MPGLVSCISRTSCLALGKCHNFPPPPSHWQAELKIILKKKRNTHTYKVNFTLRLNETKRELHVYENPFIDLQIQLNKRGNKVCQAKLNLH